MTKANEIKVLFNEARIAGLLAAEACKPNAMMVNDEVKGRSYFVPGGVCGFAWIVLKGNSAHVTYAKKFLGARKEYYGGNSIWVHDFGQSMEMKQAFAGAYAGVLQAAGINAYSQSRID